MDRDKVIGALVNGSLAQLHAKIAMQREQLRILNGVIARRKEVTRTLRDRCKLLEEENRKLRLEREVVVPRRSQVVHSG